MLTRIGAVLNMGRGGSCLLYMLHVSKKRTCRELHRRVHIPSSRARAERVTR
jgi:hypothetical protein